MPTYSEFLDTKSQYGSRSGFNPVWMPEFLFDFQAALVEYSIGKGRSAIFADCGLGKTPMQLVWAQNVIEHTNKPVLILTPLAVGQQTVKEGKKFGVECSRCADGQIGKPQVYITNYERLHYFNCNDFAGVVCDESGILKNYDGKTRAEVTEFMRTRPYRLLCTATPSPNDYDELGTSSESLGELGYQDMLGRFFKQETRKDYLGWGRTKYRIKGHAEIGFWKWICSWARACRKPSDLGFDDGKFKLPPLVTNEHEVKALKPAPGRLFDMPAFTLEEQREETRRTLNERCDKVAELVEGKKQSICWCHLNDEGDRLAEIIPDAVQVSGSDSDEVKEERLFAFADGEIKRLVTKPKIAGFGLNFQNCSHQTFFPTHSFEAYYQAVRRSWRFGQKRPVTVDMISTEGSMGVLANLQRKAEAAERMFASLVEHMNESLKIERTRYGELEMEEPAWL